MLGNSPTGGFALGGGSAGTAGVVVEVRQQRTAGFITTGGTSAAFERPTVSAAFEQADALIVR